MYLWKLKISELKWLVLPYFKAFGDILDWLNISCTMRRRCRAIVEVLTEACLHLVALCFYFQTVPSAILNTSFSWLCLTSPLYRAAISIRSFAYKWPPATQHSLPFHCFNSAPGNRANQRLTIESRVELHTLSGIFQLTCAFSRCGHVKKDLPDIPN